MNLDKPIKFFYSAPAEVFIDSLKELGPILRNGLTIDGKQYKINRDNFLDIGLRLFETMTDAPAK